MKSALRELCLIVVCLSMNASLARAESSRPSKNALIQVSSTEGIDYQRANPLRLPTTAIDSSQKSGKSAPGTKLDLSLPSQESRKSKSKQGDAIQFEPWMPGRGALGVKVEITW